ncbi:MAG: SRPBCC domain-containing protein [Candidatus Hydrogenedentes bacterium]|nr:SRPBCC domain-containing protein [Candidatus Hydrogenedentota bacterium]
MSFHASRTIAAEPSRVFAAFEEVGRLAVWWGPAGFTNTFETFAFEPGGVWSFTMHGPDGKDYPNEMVVREIDAPGRIVLEHVTQPRYVLTVTLEVAEDGGTLVGWHQEFENAETGRRLEAILVQANAELLERLSAEVLGEGGR